jgi:hypothetical protein
MPKFLTQDAVVSAQDLPYEDVEVPEWGGTVRVVGLDGEKAQEYVGGLVELNAQGQVQKINSSGLMLSLLTMSLVNEKYELLFPGEGGKKALGKKSAAVLTRLFEVAQRLSGLGTQAEAQATKNS